MVVEDGWCVMERGHVVWKAAMDDGPNDAMAAAASARVVEDFIVKRSARSCSITVRMDRWRCTL